MARLDIPPHSDRERIFEVFVGFVVAARAGAEDARHSLRVHLDGALEWSRSVETQPDGQDSLDFRVRRVVPVGQPLRIVAAGGARNARAVSLRMTADEDPG